MKKPILTEEIIKIRSMMGLNEVDQPMDEVNLRSTGIQEFVDYVNDNPAAMSYLGFSSIQRMVSYIQDADLREWDEIRAELAAYKRIHGDEKDPDFDDPINEAGVSYDPTKIDEFVAEAKKDITEEVIKAYDKKHGQ